MKNKTIYDFERGAADHLTAVIDNSVRHHLVSNVSLASFLRSGGIDSSTGVSAMAVHA